VSRLRPDLASASSIAGIIGGLYALSWDVRRERPA
jgi:hypothetical protein